MLFCIIVCWHGIHSRQRLLFGRRTSEEGSGIGLTSVEETSEYMGTMIHLLRAWPLLQGPPLSTGRKVGREILSSNLLIQLLLDSVPPLHTRIQKSCPLSQERGNNKGLMYPLSTKRKTNKQTNKSLIENTKSFSKHLVFYNSVHPPLSHIFIMRHKVEIITVPKLL